MEEKNKNLKIQAEQIALIKIEKELKEMISKVNEHINTLKVEELQLKANIISDQSKFKAPNEMNEQKYKIIDMPEYINSQTLDLKVNQTLNIFNEEYDSD